MPKSYNLGSKTDMQKFTKDLENQAMNIAESQVKNMSIDVTCPHCSAKIKAKSGKSLCAFCRKEIDVQLNFK